MNPESILSSLLKRQDPFKNYWYYSSCIVPTSHGYDMYPYQECDIPTISRYRWGTAIPSIPIKGCTNACLLHSPPEWLYGTHVSGDQSDFACHGVHWRMLRRFSTRPFRTVTVPFVCTRIISYGPSRSGSAFEYSAFSKLTKSPTA